MTDTPNFLPESRAFFRKFKEAKIQEYRYALKAYENPRRTGYGRYPNDSLMSNYLSSLINNLDEGFNDVSIPEDFSSPKLLVKKWQDFYNFLETNERIVLETAELLKNEEHTFEPFSNIYEIHNDIKGCLEVILEMNDVKEVMGNTSVLETTVEINQDVVDVVIITALHDTEFEAFENLFDDFRTKTSDDQTQYLEGMIANKKVIIATDDKMGMSAATALTLKMLIKFKPAYVIMGGIAAGVKSDDRNFGDVLVGRYTFNYESGKYQYKQKLKQTVFEPNPEPIELDGTFTGTINTLKNNGPMRESIYNRFTPTETKKKYESCFNVHFGPIASGSAVLADDKKVEQIRAGNRKLIGIDMETFGVYYGCKSFEKEHLAKAISIKSISDFADKRKTDGYRDYAAFTSASFIKEFIKTLI